MTIAGVYDGIFIGYSHLLAGVPPVFSPGDPLMIIGEEPDGVVRCCLADALGRPATAICDTLFDEELVRRTKAQGRARLGCY